MNYENDSKSSMSWEFQCDPRTDEHIWKKEKQKSKDKLNLVFPYLLPPGLQQLQLLQFRKKKNKNQQTFLKLLEYYRNITWNKTFYGALQTWKRSVFKKGNSF